MPSSCWAPGCTNRLEKGTEVKMFRFPYESNQKRRDAWIIKVGRLPRNGAKSSRKDGLLEPKEHDRLCSAHFVLGKPCSDPTDVDYLPSMFAKTPLAKKTPNILKQKCERQNRIKGREEKKNKSAAALALLSLSSEIENEVPGIATQTVCNVREMGTQTDLTSSHIDEWDTLNKQQNELINKQQKLFSDFLSSAKVLDSQSVLMRQMTDSLERRISQLEKENCDLKAKVKLCFGYQVILNNDEKTCYYTGLPNYGSFETIFKHASGKIRRKTMKLSGRDCLFMTLVKLRHNTGFVDLATRFGISKTYINKIFHEWLDALYRTLGGLIKWPSMDEPLELPEVFQNSKFNKVKCIIDCTEIFIERLSYLKARAQTYSNYKKHNTAKLLVGISPSGAVTFLSDVWGGRASDRKITMESGIIDLFVPGDIVMADRGFTMKEEFAQQCVKLIVPPFTRGKKQLSAEEVELGRELARARIHVERVIGRIKDFQVICGVMPISFVKGKKCTCRKVVTVVSAIVNLHKPLL